MHWIVLILTVLDQGSKIIVNTFFRDVTANIIGDALQFKVVLNTNQLSLYNGHLIDLNINNTILIAIGLIALAGLITFYLYLTKEKVMNRMAYTIFALSFSAIVCSTIDKFFWGGSLDFIAIQRYIIDPKDIYIGLGYSLLVVHVLNNAFRKETIYTEKQISAKGYFQFVKNSLLKSA